MMLPRAFSSDDHDTSYVWCEYTNNSTGMAFTANSTLPQALNSWLAVS